METFDLISKYAFTKLEGYKDLKITDYTVNGSIIKIEYNYLYDWAIDSSDRSCNNILEVDLLDYITFVYNLK